MSQHETNDRRRGFWLVALGLLVVCVAARADWRISYGIDPLEDLDDVQINVAEGTLIRQLAFVVLAVVGTWGLLRPGAGRLRAQGILGAVVVALTAWCFASAAWSVDPPLTSRRLFTLGATIVAAVALAKHFSSLEVLRLACVCAGLQLVLDMAFTASLGNFRPWEPGYRFAGLLHPNHEAANCALVILSSLALARGIPTRGTPTRGASKVTSTPDLACAEGWCGATNILHASNNETFTVAGAERQRCPGRHLAGASLTLCPSHHFLVTKCLILGRAKYHPGQEASSPHAGRVAYRALAALAVVMLFLAKSRTALVATVLGYCFLRLQAAGRRARIFAVSATICVGCAAFLLAGDLVADGLSKGANLGRADYADVSTLTGRVPLWEELLGEIAAQPLTGYGYGSFWSPERIFFISESQGWPVSHAHCDSIEVALALGGVGLTLYVLALALALRSAQAAHRENDRQGHDGFAALILFVAVGGVAEGIGVPYSLLQLVLMSAVARSSLIVAARRDEFAAAEGVFAGSPNHSQSHWKSRPIFGGRFTGQ